MPAYKAPLKDLEFVLNDLLDYQTHYQSFPEGREATADIVEAVLGECGKLCENVLSPLNGVGDRQGCRLEDGKVVTAPGFADAYQEYVAGGWQGLNFPTEYGGQGLPLSLGLAKQELIAGANWSWGMYPGLSIGAMNTLMLHATEDQKKTYMPPLVEGRWTGTMCLTESHCGTDLAQVACKAVENEDGSFSLSGTKIFISGGDHDLAENIVHIVLARTPDLPSGIKGISLFIVPKYLPEADGSVGAFNNVSCSALEEKMGIHGSSTCVMNFDGAKGFMLGEKGKGVANMFTFMNAARIGTSMQGIGAAELSFQGSLAYAKERMSMRSISGTKNPDKVADTIIHHPDVRRMLLTQKAFAEGGRAMLYHAGKLADLMTHAATEEARESAEDELGFFTPILKAFLTERGLEAANEGLQVFGGHGFIAEHGMEQIVRDTRISTLYEGTTGIQALDFLGRKIIGGKFKQLRKFAKEVYGFCFSHGLLSRNPHKFKMRRFNWALCKFMTKWNWITLRVVMRAAKNRDTVGAVAYDYMMFSGYVVTAYMWARMAQVAHEKIAEGTGDTAFYEAKIQTAEFYFERLLPRANAHAQSMMASVDSVMQMNEENFSFDY